MEHSVLWKAFVYSHNDVATAAFVLRSDDRIVPSDRSVVEADIRRLFIAEVDSTKEVLSVLFAYGEEPLLLTGRKTRQGIVAEVDLCDIMLVKMDFNGDRQVSVEVIFNSTATPGSISDAEKRLTGLG